MMMIKMPPRERRKQQHRQQGMLPVRHYDVPQSPREKKITTHSTRIDASSQLFQETTHSGPYRARDETLQVPRGKRRGRRSVHNLTTTTTLANILFVSLLLISSQGWLVSSGHGQQTPDSGSSGQQPELSASSSSASSSESSSSSSSSSAAPCFGGIQTFEKISMSTFESPSSQSNNGASSFGSGILVQQDDQALTSECVNLCRSQSNCLSFVIDYNKFECKSYATTQQELKQEFDAKYQQHASARSIQNNATGATNGSADGAGLSTGYLQADASSSTINFQNLLPSGSSNYFEKICLDGIANRNQFNDACGQGRLWIIERVVDSFLDGYVEKEVTNVNNKDECSKLCIFETQFVCRSADYDQQARLCRLSKEDRRTQPQAIRHAAGSSRQYLENQCATPGPSSCVYETKRNVGIISMDALKFAQTVQDCQMKCNQEPTFNCRSYSFHQQRCFLSGDDSTSLNSNLIRLPAKQGWQFGEKKCLVELCTKGVFTYEKVTGYTLRSALSSPIDLMMQSGSQLGVSVIPGNLNELEDLERLQRDESSQSKLSGGGAGGGQLLSGFYAARNNSSSSSSAAATLAAANMVSTMMAVAANRDALAGDPMHESASGRQQRSATRSNLAILNHCRHSCDLGYLNCPAFTIDYKNNRCQRLDRNSQGRHHELVAREGVAYYEKICLRVPEIMSMCQDKYWIFERVLGYELAPRLYEKALKFVQSRRDCEEYCLEEKQFQCRSALYNDETSDCKLSRYDRRLAQQEAGYNRNFNPRVSYLENQCVRDHTADGKLQCYYEQAARDEPALPTFTEHIEMVAPTSLDSERFSANSSSSSASNNNNNNKRGVSYCEQLCNDNAKFECRSFGYYPSVAQCFLSGDDTVSAGDGAYTHRTGFTYFEKKCRFAPQNQNHNQTSIDHNNDPYSGGNVPDQNPYFQPATRRPPLQGGANSTSTTTSTADSLAEPEDTITVTPKPPNRPMFGGGGGADYGAGGAQKPPAAGEGGEGEGTTPTSNEAAANLHKCGQGHSFVYQRIPGFEPIGGYLTLLVKDNNRPGIVGECAELCRSAFECRAFVVDYANNQCFAMLENSGPAPGQQLLSLRQIIGKDYFEGFCVANHIVASGSGHAHGKSCRNQTWLMDKIVDQAVVGVQPARILANSDRVQCRLACLEERLFYCKSAMFEGPTRECKLYSIDRESIAQMRLVFTKGVDFYENQCQIQSSTCPYDAIERDLTIVTVTRSVHAKSTFDCEHACNTDTTFNCRSYTYLDKYPSLPNLCLLSSDSRSTSQKGSVREHPRTLYAERNCYFRRPRIPAGVHEDNPDPIAGGDPYSPISSSNLPPPPTSPMGDGIERGIEHHRTNVQYDPAGPPATVTATTTATATDLALGAQPCKSHQFTFERTFGYDFRLAPKERAPIAPSVGIAIACQQECLRRAERCQSFVVEYKLPFQSCFLIETQVGANKRLLVRSPNSAYFEKICLPRPGLLQEHHSSANSPYSSAPPESAHLQDMAPGYSHEPWSPQPPPSPMLPYYLQQQQLVESYPSRACPKLWSFERFVNFNFTASPDKVIGENVFTRAQCESLCLNEANFSCRAATYDYNSKLCRLFKNSRRTVMSQFQDLELSSRSSAESSSSSSSNNSGSSSDGSPIRGARLTAAAAAASGAELAANLADGLVNIDYMENTCAPEPSSCQYRQLYDLYSPYIEKIQHAVSLSDCQRQCDLERLFGCKSINYDPATKKCMLINEDLISLNRGQSQQQQQPQAGLIPRKNSVYSEKGNCELISVQCNSQEMLVSINFDTPFRGRIMAKGNPEQCFMVGDGQTSLQFPIVFGPKCNSRQEGQGNFVNEIVIQQHPIIMTDSDKTVRVMCAFEAPEQTITLKNPSSRDQNRTGIDVVVGGGGGGGGGGSADSSRTRHDKQHQHQQQFNSFVSNKAPPPSVMLRILDQSGRDASMINLGDDLVLKIQMPIDQTSGQNSALGIFARNLVARSSNGESLMLIDNDGCPVDHQLFPGLDVDPKDGRSLYSTFRAFRFPSSGLVNFEVQIRFCPERCQPVECQPRLASTNGARLKSFGRRKRRKRQTWETELFASSEQHQAAESSGQRASILQSINPTSLEVPGTLMKPGKAFQFVRELLSLTPQQQQEQQQQQQQQPPRDNLGPPAEDKAPESMIEEPNRGGSSQEVAGAENADGDEFDSPRGEVPTGGRENGGVGPSSESSSGPETVISASAEMDPPKSERPFEKNILLHVDERIVPATNQISPSASSGPSWPMLNHNQQAAPPYGRFPFPDHHLMADTHRPQQEQAHSGAPNVAAPAPAAAAVETPVGLGQISPAASAEEAGPEAFEQNVRASQAADRTQQGTNTAKDVPLRFSILVGEGGQNAVSAVSAAGSAGSLAPPTGGGGGGGGWPPAGASSNPMVVIPNSSSLDMDLVVAAGKDPGFQSLDGQSEPHSMGGMQLAAGDHNSIESTKSSTELSSTSPSPSPSPPLNYNETPYGMPSDVNNKVTSSNGKRASYEQIFDAQPSTSVAAEVSIDQANPPHPDPDQNLSRRPGADHLNHHHHHQQSASASAGGQQLNAPAEVAAASRDCQIDSGQRRLWTIIWTGAFVIALNICLVIVSLVLYFKKVHLRQNHSIVHTSSSSTFDDGGIANHHHLSSGRRRPRWPSVLLKSKNDLGTSLNAHEHFFCKLNSKQPGLQQTSTTNLVNDFNWPNLSSSSSHSTISSMASPMPVSSVRIHHQNGQLKGRPTAFKYPFDTQASIRNNFNPGFRGILDGDDQQQTYDIGNPSCSANVDSNYNNNSMLTRDDAESHLDQSTR